MDSGKTLLLTLKLVCLSLLLASLVATVQAQTETVLYSFSGGTDGRTPTGLLVDAKGNLYGMTQAGGAFGLGTVFELTLAGRQLVLHSFAGGSDGASPSFRASLVLDAAGNLYGTTSAGGAFKLGTVFEITASGSAKVLYSFKGGVDGSNPQAGLVQDASGNFFGTTSAGGAFGAGTVFELDNTGGEKVLYSFAGGADGGAPAAALVLDAQGNLLGTTTVGGGFHVHCPVKGCGTVFKVTPAGKETVVLQFFKFDNGVDPEAPVVLDAQGNIFGTTFMGGPSAYGLFFKVTPAGQESWIHFFNDHNLTGDGGYPIGPMVRDAQGNFYGVTYKGGVHNQGTVFRVAPTRVETVLHSFTGTADGGYPQSGLIMDALGNFYGTTLAGGASGKGTVFKLTVP